MIQVSIKFGILKTIGVMLFTKHMYTGKKVQILAQELCCKQQRWEEEGKCMPRAPTSF
jgi:hypothetical protein